MGSLLKDIIMTYSFWVNSLASYKYFIFIIMCILLHSIMTLLINSSTSHYLISTWFYVDHSNRLKPVKIGGFEMVFGVNIGFKVNH